MIWFAVNFFVTWVFLRFAPAFSTPPGQVVTPSPIFWPASNLAITRFHVSDGLLLYVGVIGISQPSIWLGAAALLTVTAILVSRHRAQVVGPAIYATFTMVWPLGHMLLSNNVPVETSLAWASVAIVSALTCASIKTQSAAALSESIGSAATMHSAIGVLGWNLFNLSGDSGIAFLPENSLPLVDYRVAIIGATGTVFSAVVGLASLGLYSWTPKRLPLAVFPLLVVLMSGYRAVVASVFLLVALKVARSELLNKWAARMAVASLTAPMWWPAAAGGMVYLLSPALANVDAFNRRSDLDRTIVSLEGRADIWDAVSVNSSREGAIQSLIGKYENPGMSLDLAAIEEFSGAFTSPATISGHNTLVQQLHVAGLFGLFLWAWIGVAPMRSVFATGNAGTCAPLTHTWIVIVFLGGTVSLAHSLGGSLTALIAVLGMTHLSARREV